MGKNKNKKKKGVGRIIKLFRNYGYISTDSFGQEGEELPFQFTPEMIKEINGIEYIEYSKEVEFLSLIHISEPTRLHKVSRMPSSA